MVQTGMEEQRSHQYMLQKAGRELVFLTLLFVGALGLGLLANLFRSQPLPMHYQSKAQRLSAAVEGVAGKPADQRPSPSDQIRRVSADELRTMLDQKAVVVVDARAALFFRHGHVPGALSLPREGFRSAYEQHRAALEVNAAPTIVVYCQSATCEDSTLVAAALRDLGHGGVLILSGGWNEWQARGFPMSREEPR